MNLKNIIKKHWSAIFLAFVFGTIMILPTIFSIEKIGPENFKGIYPLLSGDEDHYLALVREAYDGHLNMGNPYIKEYKNNPYTQPPLAEIYYAGFAKMTGVSVATSATVNDFILPFISVLLLYSLFFRLSKSKKTSLVFSGLFFLFFISSFNRPVNPQFSFIFLLLGLHLVWLICEKKHSIKNLIIYNVLLSMVFGILFYVYPFYWMTIAVLYAILTLMNLWQEKDFNYWFKGWVGFLAPVFILFMPFAFNLMELMKSPFFGETNLRSGFINTHIPGAFLDISIMVFCAPIVYLLQKLSQKNNLWQNKKEIFLCWALIISGIILNWQNVVTGKTMQFPPHFYPVMILFVFIISVIFFSNAKIKKIKDYSGKELTLFALIFLLFVGIAYKQKDEVLYTVKNIYYPIDISSVQKLSEPMKWLDENTPMDSTVYTLGKNYDWAIPIYTHNNLYFVGNAGYFLMSDDELENRWVIQHFFDAISQSDIIGNRDIWANKFIDIYQNQETRRKIVEFLTGKKYPPTVLMNQKYVDEILKKYAEFKKMGFEKAVKIYDVDYIILDTDDIRYKDLEKTFKNYSFLSLVVQIDKNVIYKVK